jgi:hypothetical protein
MASSDDPTFGEFLANPFVERDPQKGGKVRIAAYLLVI